jgi:serine acetyltransferase
MAAVTLRETLGLIRRDLRAHRAFFRRNLTWGNGVSWLVHPGWLAVFLYRWCRYFHHKPLLRPAARLLYLLNIFLTKSEMTPVSDLGGGFVVIHPAGNIIASAKAGKDCVMVGGGLGGGGSRKDIGAGPGQPVLEDRVFFGRQGFSLGAYRVRSGAAVGPKCFVHRDLEEGEFLPAQVDDLTFRKRMGGRRDARLDDEAYHTPTGVVMGGDDAD